MLRAEPAALRLVPSEVELVVVTPRPAHFWKLIENHPVSKELYRNELFQALYDSNNYRRIEQLIVYFEKKLGKSRTEVLERLTEKGAVLGARLSSNPGVVAIIEAGDENLLHTFLTESIQMVEEELDRQGSKERFRKGEHQKVPTLSLGGKLHLAQAGTNLIVASDEKLFKQALDLHRDLSPIPEGSILKRFSRFERATRSLALAWAWLDFEAVQRNKEFKEGLKAATTDGFLKLFAGGFLDILKRTPSIQFELSEEGKNFRFRVMMPRGTEGMSEVAKTFVSTKEKCLLPPLTPPRVISSTSWTFDLGHIWRNKKEWLGAEADKQLAKAEKDLKPFLGGVNLGDLLHDAGWNQRVVFAEVGKSPYTIKPAQPVGAFAVVFEIRDKRFVQSMNKVLRAAALAGTFQFGWKMKEEEYKGNNIVAYYFDDKRPFPADTENLRFNFNPAFVQVGNQFIVSSTAELARDLVDCVNKDEKRLSAGTSWRTDVFAMGLADNLKSSRETLLAATILDQGLPPKEASKQIDALVELVRSLGTVRWDIHYGTTNYHMDFLWQYGK